MAEMPPGTVWIASYPKSGNTWMRILLSNLLSGRETAEDINRLAVSEGIATGRRAFEDQAAIDSSLLTREETERMRPDALDGMAAERAAGTLVKVHDAFVRRPDGTPLLGRAARAALYLVRDPRDVAVSYACHSDGPVSDTVQYMNDPEAEVRDRGPQLDHRLLDWSGHVTSWIDAPDLPVLAIRYEDLLADTAGTFARALDFLGVRRTAGEAERAAHFAQFSELQRQESETGFRERVSSGAPFFRSGRAGAWRGQLPEESAAALVRAHGATMARLGYATDESIFERGGCRLA